MKNQSRTAWTWATIAMLAAGGGVALAATGGILAPPKFTGDTAELFTGDPLKLLGPGKPGGNLPTAPTTGAPAGTNEPAMASGGARSWSKLISPENLEAEVKAQLPVVNDSVKTLQNFKGNGREKAQNGYTVLTALFAVIAQYDGDVRWKKDATALRNKFSQVSLNCKTSSDAAYKEAKVRSEDLAAIIGGNTVDLPKGEVPDELGKLMSRPPLMKRMEESRLERLGPWASDKGSFNKNKDSLMREAQFLAMLSEVLKDPTFDSGDDATYVGYAAALQKECVSLIDAIKSDDQSGAQTAISRLSKACDTCHGEYR